MVILSRNIYIFVKVAETKNITETSRELFISQPAVSKAISLLEEELQVRLFVRDKKHGLLLTNAGEQILKTATQMMALEDQMYQYAFSEKNLITGTVKVGARPALTSTIFAVVLAQFQKDYPGITIHLIEDDSSKLNQMIEDRTVDFGLTFSPFGHLQHRDLFRDHPIAISREPFPDDAPFLLNNASEGVILCQSAKETIVNSLGIRAPSFSRCMIVKQPESVIRLVEKNCGIGILSKLVYHLDNSDLYVKKVSPDISLTVGITAVDFNELSPAAKLMVDRILNVFPAIDMAEPASEQTLVPATVNNL